MAHITPSFKNPSRELNWLDLPNHVLLLITDRLITQIKDFIRFGAVCMSWRSFYTQNLHWYRTHLPPQLPLLMLSTTDGNVENCSFLYNITEKELYNFPFFVPNDENCCGSTQGWLVTVDRYTSKIRLLNPWLAVNNEIELPPLADQRGKDEDEGVRVDKVVLSANPTWSSSYIVVAIYDGYNRLAFFKPGEKDWISFNKNDNVFGFDDVIYYKDLLYAVNSIGEVFICDVNPFKPMVSKFIERPLVYHSDQRYLVESNGGLLQIIFLLKQSGFTVLRLDPVELKWIETKNLSGRVLFLGKNSSMSLLASDFPGCKANSIYFTAYDNIFEMDYMKPDGPYKKVFNMKDGSIEPHCPKLPSKLFLPPIWVLPTL